MLKNEYNPKNWKVFFRNFPPKVEKLSARKQNIFFMFSEILFNEKKSSVRQSPDFHN